MRPEKKTVQVQEEKPEIKDENGFHCPECRFKMRVYLTKPLTGSVYRVRICDRCGHREPTEEKAI